MPCPPNSQIQIAYGMNHNNAILEAVSVQYGFFSTAEMWAMHFDQMIPTIFHVTSLDDEIEMWVKFSQDLRRAINIDILPSADLDEDLNKGDKMIKDMIRPNL